MYLRDLHPTVSDKWVSTTIVHKLGPLAYAVSVNGNTRQAHVDYLKPQPDTQLVSKTALTIPDNYRECFDQCSDSVRNPLVIIDDGNPDVDEEPDHVMDIIPATATHPQRNHQPPHRLIEELP